MDRMIRAAAALVGIFALGAALTLIFPGRAMAAGMDTCSYGPCGGNALISVSGVTQAPNGVVTLSVQGSEWLPGETVEFTADGPVYFVGSAQASSAGDLSISIVLPEGYSAGVHTLSALGSESGRTASTMFTLLAPSAAPTPCASTTAASTVGTASVVLAAFYLTSCPTQLPLAPQAAGAPPASGTSPSLPFTGADLTAMSGVAAFVICAGGLLVLSARRRRRSF